MSGPFGGDLGAWQFELGDVLFGCGTSIEVTELDLGSFESRTQDVELATSDGRVFGRDFKSAATWSMTLTVKERDEESALITVGRLRDVWDAEDARGSVGGVVPLRYRLGGRSGRIYGRPRRFTPVLKNVIFGRVPVVCDFAAVDHRFYADDVDTWTIGIAPPLDADAGITTPFTPPFTLAAGSSERQSSVSVRGDKPAPVTLTIRGPVANARVSTSLWTAALVDPVAVDDPVTIDASPWVRAATKQSGGGVRVSPRVTRISQMWLPPGHHDVVFSGVDATGSAEVEVAVRPVYRSLR